MVGAFATGKTSLVARFVKGIYSDKYQTTIGVKIDKKQVETAQASLNMVLWDIHGEDEFQNVRMSYLRGASAYILVLDGTRRETLEVALSLKSRVAENIGDIPFIAVINKFDLRADWEMTDEDMALLERYQWDIVCSSAKTGLGVENCFLQLAEKIMDAA